MKSLKIKSIYFHTFTHPPLNHFSQRQPSKVTDTCHLPFSMSIHHLLSSVIHFNPPLSSVLHFNPSFIPLSFDSFPPSVSPTPSLIHAYQHTPTSNSFQLVRILWPLIQISSSIVHLSCTYVWHLGWWEEADGANELYLCFFNINKQIFIKIQLFEYFL